MSSKFQYRRLDKNDAAVLLVDHQSGLCNIVGDFSPDEVFVVTDASGTFNPVTRESAWARMSQAGAQLMTWFGVACELHRDWRNDIEGLGQLFSNHLPAYRNLITSYYAKR